MSKALDAVLAAAPQPESQPQAEFRTNEDGSLDELVGHGRFHLEQMDTNHWWMALETPLGRYTVGLHAKGKITALYELERHVAAAIGAAQDREGT